MNSYQNKYLKHKTKFQVFKQKSLDLVFNISVSKPVLFWYTDKNHTHFFKWLQTIYFSYI